MNKLQVEVLIRKWVSMNAARTDSFFDIFYETYSVDSFFDIFTEMQHTTDSFLMCSMKLTPLIPMSVCEVKN